MSSHNAEKIKQELVKGDLTNIVNMLLQHTYIHMYIKGPLLERRLNVLRYKDEACRLAYVYVCVAKH